MTSWMSAAEVAARLGVQRQTVYAYVSRGLLPRTVADDGRTSRFDPADVERLRQGARTDTDGELQTLIATRITRVSDDGLLLRGRSIEDLVADDRGWFDAVDLLWEAPESERWPQLPGPSDARRTPTVDDLRRITSERSAADPLRSDLSPHAVRAVGRELLVALVAGLPSVGTPLATDEPIALLWSRLTALEATPRRLRALELALVLLADHGLASSTFGARIAASVRADPYSVVIAGLGVVGGTLHGAASSAVHQLYASAASERGVAEAVGSANRQTGGMPGFGHAVYRVQDPRYRLLMAAIIDAWEADVSLRTVQRVRDVIEERHDGIPNVDLALGALTFLAGMDDGAGEVIFALARTAGWLAHAMEEYEEAPLRFRPRARWVGP